MPPLTPLAVVGVTILTFWLVAALLAPIIAPYGERDVVWEVAFGSPGEAGILGSDLLARDVLSRVLYGSRTTLGLAAMAALIAFAVGITAGLTAAVLGGWVDGALSRVNDAAMSFPSIILALIVIAGLGTSVWVLVVTVGLIEATRVFRLSRALGMDISVMEYVEAARARGEGWWWIVRHEILPNAAGPLAADFGLRFTYGILFISALSFLGLGVQPPHADWGGMVRENMSGLLYGSLAPLVPAAAIASVTVGVNLVVEMFLARANRDISQELFR